MTSTAMPGLVRAGVPWLVLGGTVAIFGAALGPPFFSPFALSLIVQQVTVTTIVAAAQALVILTGGIDLSLGAILVLAMVVMGQAVFTWGWPGWAAVLAGLAAGAACGAINGVLTARARLPAFIVTLGTWQIFGTAAYLVSRHETIRSQDVEAQAPLLHVFGHSVNIGGAVITLGVAAAGVLLAVLWYILSCTPWGRHAYAVGDNPEAAALTGLPVRRIRETAYIGAGLIAALAGWVMIGRIGSITPTVGELINIEAVTAAVIGGISLGGGRGSVLGALVGALTVGAFSLGLRLLGSNAQWITAAIGACTVLAVLIDTRLRRAT
jgi:fructose transport system permease protein